MSLMSFLSSPLGSIVGGAAETASDVYWNITRPEAKEAEKAFAQLVKDQKAKYNAAVSSGTATRSALKAGAQTLKNTVPEFRDHSIEDLISTIQAVKIARNVDSGNAIKYLIDERGKGFTVQTKDTKGGTSDKKEASDVSAQTTSMLTGGGGTAPKAPVKENRGVLTRMLVGESTHTIQDRALKSLGMTRADLNKLYSTPVLKQLNIGKPVIDFALKREVSPYITAAIADINKSLIKSNSTDIQINMGKDQDGQPVIINGEAFELEIMGRLAEAEKTGDLSGVLPLLNRLNTAKADKNFPGLASQIPKIYDNLTAAYKFMGGNTPGLGDNRLKVTELVNKINKFINTSLGNENLTTQQKKENLVEVNKLQSEINIILQDKGPILPTVVKNKEEEDAVRDFLVELAQKNENVTINNKEMPAKDALNTFNKHIRFMKQGEKGAFTAANITELGDIVALAEGSVPPISIEEVSRQIFNNDARLQKEIAGLEFPPEESRKPKATDVSFLHGSQVVDNIYNMTNKDLLLKYERLWADFSKNPYNEELEKKVRDVQNELAMRNPKKGEKPSTIINDIMSPFVGRLNTKSDNTNTPEYLRSAIFNLQEAAQDLSAQFTNEEISVEQLRTGRDSLQSTYNSIISTGNSFVSRANPILNMVEEVVKKVSIQESDRFSREDIINLIKMERDMQEIVRTAQTLPPEQQEAALVALVESQTAFITASQLSNTEAVTPSEIDEKVEAILALEKQRVGNMTPLQEETARVLIKGLLAQGNLVTTKDGIFMRSFNADTGNVELIQVPSLTGGGNPITLNREQLIKNEEGRQKALKGEATTGSILKTFMDHPNAFNLAGTVQLFGLDVADLFNSMGADAQPLFGSDEKSLQEMERARNRGIELLGTAKDILFDDPRLSDQDLAIVRRYIKVLENTSLLGTSRGQAALGVIQAAMTKDAMLREKDADFDNKVVIAEPIETLSDVQLAEMSKPQRYVHSLETRLGFKIGIGSPDSLAKTAFYRTLKTYGINKFATPAEAKAMSEKERELYKHKVNFAVQQMQFVMSDIYVYVANGAAGKDNVVNQFLQNYKDLEE